MQQNDLVGDTGLEHLLNSPDNSQISNQSGAESGALDAQTAPIDPDLVSVIEAWPTLPDAIRAGIVAMVRVGQK